MFALVDCNNFFVSCERVFLPALDHQPVVVLSNNDGCIISRSNEAKALGIPMGAPFFQVEALIRKHQVQYFSSNFELYGDLSYRVMQTLAEFTDEYEIYSIDEAFLDLSSFNPLELEKYAKQIQQTVKQWTGIPVSIGIAPTKTLAKVANFLAKQDKSWEGICLLKDSSTIDQALSLIPAAALWGIGHNYAQLLSQQSIKTGLDFKNSSSHWIQQKMKVMGLRLQQELQGQVCFDLESSPSTRKGIHASRSFGQAVESLEELAEAVACYAAEAAEKLRKEQLEARVLTVAITTKRYGERPYYNSKTLEFEVATAYTPNLIRFAQQALREIYRSGYRYKKAGVYLIDLRPQQAHQLSLFQTVDREKEQRLMKIVDLMRTQKGKQALQWAAQGIQPRWQMKKNFRSPRYTTQWQELKRVRA